MKTLTAQLHELRKQRAEIDLDALRASDTLTEGPALNIDAIYAARRAPQP